MSAGTEVPQRLVTEKEFENYKKKKYAEVITNETFYLYRRICRNGIYRDA